MGKEKYQKKIRELLKKSPVVSYDSINRIINLKKNKKQYTKQFLRNLLLKNKIIRLTKGFYTLHDDPSLIVFCFKPSYLGLQDALSFHNLWEQETIPVILTARKIRQGLRVVNGSNVLVRRIKKKYFFGIDYYKHEDFYLPYSDIEKTFIDMVYFKEKLNEEVLNNFKEKINKKKLDSYLKHFPKITRKKVISALNKE